MEQGGEPASPPHTGYNAQRRLWAVAALFFHGLVMEKGRHRQSLLSILIGHHSMGLLVM